jgi:hypothetical protein
VDGVINLGLFASSRERGHRRRRDGWVSYWLHGQAGGTRIHLNRNLGPMLLSLAAQGAELAWATTWEDEANEAIGPLLGLPPLPAVPAQYLNKAATAIPWTAGRPWAWLDDSDYELKSAVRRTRAGVPCLPVLVDPQTGLTGEHVQAVSEWLRALRD